MNMDRARPLVAFILVALVCAAIMIEGIGATAQGSRVAAPSSEQTPDAVDGFVFTARPSDGFTPSRTPAGSGQSAAATNPDGASASGPVAQGARSEPAQTWRTRSDATGSESRSGSSGTRGTSPETSWIERWRIDPVRPGGIGQGRGQGREDNPGLGAASGQPRSEEHGPAKPEKSENGAGKAKGKARS